MELLHCIVKSHHHVEEILTGFLELGIRGATVVDVRGMGQIISKEIPIFAGFEALFPGGKSHTYLIMSVLEEEQVEEVIGMTREVCGDFSEPGSGIIFTTPVNRVIGMAAELE